VHRSAFDATNIKHFFQTHWGKRFASDGGFGSGQAAQAFVDVLKTDAFWANGLQKSFE
jgi:hypothetical protein